MTTCRLSRHAVFFFCVLVDLEPEPELEMLGCCTGIKLFTRLSPSRFIDGLLSGKPVDYFVTFLFLLRLFTVPSKELSWGERILLLLNSDKMFTPHELGTSVFLFGLLSWVFTSKFCTWICGQAYDGSSDSSVIYLFFLFDSLISESKNSSKFYWVTVLTFILFLGFGGFLGMVWVWLRLFLSMKLERSSGDLHSISLFCYTWCSLICCCICKSSALYFWMTYSLSSRTFYRYITKSSHEVLSSV